MGSSLINCYLLLLLYLIIITVIPLILVLIFSETKVLCIVYKLLLIETTYRLTFF